MNRILVSMSSLGMVAFSRVAHTCLLVLVLLTLPGCGCSSCDDPGPASGPPLAQAPQFLLQDRNDSSSTYTQQLSPRAYLGGISAWYFGHAT